MAKAQPMASNSNTSLFNIGDYVIVNDIDIGYVTHIDVRLKVLSIINAITNRTHIDTPFTSCCPTTMANESCLRSRHDHHANTITVTQPPPLVPESLQAPIQRSPLDRFKSILLSARQWKPNTSTHHLLMQYIKEGNDNKEKRWLRQLLQPDQMK